MFRSIGYVHYLLATLTSDALGLLSAGGLVPTYRTWRDIKWGRISPRANPPWLTEIKGGS